MRFRSSFNGATCCSVPGSARAKRRRSGMNFGPRAGVSTALGRLMYLHCRRWGCRDGPRPGAPRTVEDARIEAVVARTLENLPHDGTHWSSRGMARASGLSVSTVQRIWRAFGLAPHRVETFKLSTDPDFVAKVRMASSKHHQTPASGGTLQEGRSFKPARITHARAWTGASTMRPWTETLPSPLLTACS